ncbi:MAG: metalloregulator ArsR/SmtB family transcription factor [Thermodesulfobacteriota bacterium]
MKPLELAQICKCLSADTRLRLLRLLKDHSLCVGALARRLGITPGAVSQHLRILRQAGLVVPEKRGYFVHYRVDQRALDQWLSTLQKTFGPQAGREYGPPPFSLTMTPKGE